MANNMRRRFLPFITGSDRPPLGGLGSLNFTVQKDIVGGPRLPSAQTCFNKLVLPEYSSKQMLELAIFRAIDGTEGFGLA